MLDESRSRCVSIASDGQDPVSRVRRFESRIEWREGPGHSNALCRRADNCTRRVIGVFQMEK